MHRGVDDRLNDVCKALVSVSLGCAVLWLRFRRVLSHSTVIGNIAT